MLRTCFQTMPQQDIQVIVSNNKFRRLQFKLINTGLALCETQGAIVDAGFEADSAKEKALRKQLGRIERKYKRLIDLENYHAKLGSTDAVIRINEKHSDCNQFGQCCAALKGDQ
ncbi:hypothetical protein [Desulfuromonas sp. AOP6]|uniref:hypothetical protein n=1 Tax=Desulfuromonas sp. AOP6 TaxID=1566351 RepID=UPI00128776F3|nr:hypothetical protein [Desulfuromonas sp. AOP6]BCA80308.1 hypothetical protein AOP6_2095 [Desulfuromonas sp. AOP6]